MGATFFPAVEKPYEMESGVMGWYHDTVVERTYTDDPDFGRMADETPFELHVSYGSVYRLLEALGYDWDTETWSGTYDIVEFTNRVLDRLQTYDPEFMGEPTTARRLNTLATICLYGVHNGATAICWS